MHCRNIGFGLRGNTVDGKKDEIYFRYCYQLKDEALSLKAATIDEEKYASGNMYDSVEKEGFISFITSKPGICSLYNRGENKNDVGFLFVISNVKRKKILTKISMKKY